jgi:hypothetical protein
MIEPMLGATGAATFFVTGLATGALLCYWRSSVKRRREPVRRAIYPMPWDIHCVLNAMNKMALTAERARPIEPGLIYMLSDYLLHSTLIQREDGWVDRNTLEAWLMAHARVLADHRSQTSLPSVTVNVSDSVRRIHGHKLVRQVMWCLHKALTVRRIHIEVQPVPNRDRVVDVRVLVEGDRDELGKLTQEEGAPSSWNLRADAFVCEFRSASESQPRA